MHVTMAHDGERAGEPPAPEYAVTIEGARRELRGGVWCRYAGGSWVAVPVDEVHRVVDAYLAQAGPKKASRRTTGSSSAPVNQIGEHVRWSRTPGKGWCLDRRRRPFRKRSHRRAPDPVTVDGVRYEMQCGVWRRFGDGTWRTVPISEVATVVDLARAARRLRRIQAPRTVADKTVSRAA